MSPHCNEPFSISIDNRAIKNSNDKKLLGVNLNNRLGNRLSLVFYYNFAYFDKTFLGL